MKVGKGRRKKKRLKGDINAMRGYDEDMYGGGDFNETRDRNLYSVCKESGHKASRHRRRGQQVHTKKLLIFLVKLFHMSVNVTLNIYMCFHIMFLLQNK